MKHHVFDAPVEVFVGLGMPRAITSPFQAYTFLRETPCERHRALHRDACEACLAAIEGRADAVHARRALVLYADAAGIMAPEFEEASLLSAGVVERVRRFG